MILDSFLQLYVTELRTQVEELKEDLVRSPKKNLKHTQGRIEGIRSALETLESSLERTQEK